MKLVIIFDDMKLPYRIYFCLLIFLWTSTFSLRSQWSELSASVYPELPFSLERALEMKYEQAVLQLEENFKGTDDISGLVWSVSIQKYDSVFYNLKEGQLNEINYYNAFRDKQRSLRYTYKDRLIAVVDDMLYNASGEEQLQYSYLYFYRENKALQKIKIFPKDKEFRILHDYAYDDKGRLQREKISTLGKAQQMQTVISVEEEHALILDIYQPGALTRKFYRDLHIPYKTIRTQLNEAGQPIHRKIMDEQNNVLEERMFSYEDQKLVKEQAYRTTELDPELIETIYYWYDFDGLISHKIVERGLRQWVLRFRYF